MAIFRQFIAPFLIVLVFLFALVVVSARAFLPGDMAAPAPVEESQPTAQRSAPEAVAGLPPSLKALVQGAPETLPSAL